MMDGVEKGSEALPTSARVSYLSGKEMESLSHLEVQRKHVNVQTIPFETMQEPRVLSFTPPLLSFASSLTALSL